MRLKGTLVGLACLGFIGAKNLCDNPDFRGHSKTGADGYAVGGGAVIRFLGDPDRDVTDWGCVLSSTQPSAVVTHAVDVGPSMGQWYRFTVRGLPQANFNADDLSLRVTFHGANGDGDFDGKSRPIFGQIEKARKDLTANGDNHRRGAEVWQSYQMDFVVPFAQVRRLSLSVGFDHGAATKPTAADFLVTAFSLEPIDGPVTPAKPAVAVVPKYETLIPLGGRWFYAAPEGKTKPPAKFDASNADRLVYKDDVLSAPFGNNTTAYLHEGNIDRAGKTVKADTLVDDNVTVTIDGGSLVVHTHGLPNHPTGVFPGENPSSIAEQDSTYYIPLDPKVNPKHVITTKDNSNHALPMGPIGVAANGVVFYNPFDANSMDASNIMDRCCGHPNPDGQYHYHKYPVCVNSPWADEGKRHSPVLGFAFDGFAVYGPYESADVMAKDVKGEGALNEFNLHYDPQRGWHYHVSPGVFPYIIGGYWGDVDRRDTQHGPPGGRGGPGGRRRPQGPPPDDGFGPP